MRIHLLGLPHTITHRRFSHCAFTGKIRRFAPMLQAVGYEVVHYGVEGAESGAKEQVEILTYETWRELGGAEPSQVQFGSSLSLDSTLYRTFNQILARELQERVEYGDVVAFPMGIAHQPAAQKISLRSYFLETGIGYPVAWTPHRVYESYAWLHFHLGKSPLPSGEGNDYWWVIPNYYEPDDWPLGDGAGDYVAYLGRLNWDKGMQIIVAMATARPDLTFWLCGQGDPRPWLIRPNIRYRPPIHGDGVAEYLGAARCVVMPTRYVEPFGGVSVESMLCGTPVLGSSFGAFTETLEPEFRCHTLQEWLDGLERAPHVDRAALQMSAIRRYSTEVIGPKYARVLRQIADLGREGWNTRR